MRRDDQDQQEPQAIDAQLRRALKRGSLQLDEIRDLVCALVDAMKRQGATPEKVLIAVKTAVFESMPQRWTLKTRNDVEEIAQQAVVWCIEHYYTSGES